MKKRTDKILIVDDEFDDLDTMKQILAKKGYKVECATGGKQALKMLVKNSFKLIIIDILMPELSGYELLKIIRHKYNHSSKLVYVSIVPKKEVDLKGADGFIQKPFTPEEFIENVNKALR